MFTETCETTIRTTRIGKVLNLGVRRLTRAHVTLGSRPQIAVDGHQGCEQIAAALRKHLDLAIDIRARLLDASTNPFGGLSRHAAFALIELGAHGARCVLEVELPILLLLLERIAGASGKYGPGTRLTRIEEAAFGYLCLLALAAVRPGPLGKRFAARVVSVHGERGEVLERTDCTQRHLGIELSISVGEASGGAKLLVPAASLHVAVQDVPEVRPDRIAPEVLAARLPTRAFIGRTCLDAVSVSTLAPGDVVLFDGVEFRGGALAGPGRVVTPAFELHGEFAAHGLLVSGVHPRAFPQEPNLMPHPNPLDDLSTPEFPVDVEIELARLRLPLADLANLRAGAVLPLHVNPSDPVTLRVGDRAIARAELVEIEGELGARLIALLP